MESHKLAMLQEQLAAAMTEQAEAEAVVREIERDLEAEFADQYQRLRQAKADAKALEEMARLEIEAYYARTGEKPDLKGFSVQQRQTVVYDAAGLLEWAIQYHHGLLALNESAIKGFVDQCQTATDPETGEKCWLYDGAPVPAIVTTKPTAEIQRKALISWLDERRFNAEHETQEV